jgi:hypothetical protein
MKSSSHDNIPMQTYARQLSDMAIAYLLTPDHRLSACLPVVAVDRRELVGRGGEDGVQADPCRRQRDWGWS